MRFFLFLTALGLIGGGCTADAPTSVLVTLEPDVPGSKAVFLSIYSPKGMPVTKRRLPNGSGAFALPGTVVIEVDDDIGKINLVAEAVDGLSPPQTMSFAQTPAWVSLPPRKQTKVTLVFKGPAIDDLDGDLVPDNIDNCRDVFNPPQDDKDRNGKGDACDGSPLADRAPELPDGGGVDGDAGTPGDGVDTAADQRDGAIDSPTDTPSADRMWPGTCDPVTQDCPAGQKCVSGCTVAGFMMPAFTCVADPGGTAVHGAMCGGGTGIACLKGADCFNIPSDGAAMATCRKYCYSMTDCPAGKACTTGGPVCMAGATPFGRLCAL